MHHKRIICDIDDTISFTTNRDWENAVPNEKVIKKINYLYENGWEIFLVTARGQVTCNGDIEKADNKYRGIIEDWLKRHNVNYHKLSFQKFLGTYYVDDKNLTPEDFVDLEIVPLMDGKSGAEIEKRGERVYKTHPTREKALNEATWYNLAKNFVRIPKLHSVIDKTLCIDYIYNDGGYVQYGYLVSVLDTFRQTPIMNQHGFQHYLEKISTDHAQTIESLGIKIDYPNYEKFNDYKSFCHGDFTLDNILISEEGEYLIDPIYKDSYSSWLLDASKMLHSLRKYSQDLLYDSLFGWVENNTELNKIDILYLEYLHWIRIYKYALEEEKPDINKEIIELYRRIYD